MDFEWLFNPLAKMAGNNKTLRTVHGIVDPAGYGTKRIPEGYKKGGVRGAFGGLSDTAAFGAGDFLSPQFTDKVGDNPIYDRVGPIMAGYWGGPVLGSIADEYAKGSKYNEVGNMRGGLLSSGAGMYTGANSWFTQLLKSLLGGSSSAGSTNNTGLNRLLASLLSGDNKDEEDNRGRR